MQYWVQNGFPIWYMLTELLNNLYADVNKQGRVTFPLVVASDIDF